MKISAQKIGGELIISLAGELDHHAARNAIPEISELIDVELPIKLTIDFDRVSFMDSSGIALVIGAYKRARSIDSEFIVINVSRQSHKVFDAAGICNLMNILKKEESHANL